MRERRVLERQAKALLRVPDRKEREEVEALKAELEKAKAEAAARDGRLKMAVDRLKQQLQAAHTERDELRDEVRTLERERLDASTAANDAARREAPSRCRRGCRRRRAPGWRGTASRAAARRSAAAG